VVATRNLTLRLSVETVKRARLVAAQRGTSIRALVAGTINELAGEAGEEDDAFAAAKRQALRVLGRGFRLGGGPLSRDAMHRR
jgi:hypothetical protein